MALMFAGRRDEAMVAADGLIEAAEAARNTHALVGSLLADGVAFRYADPARALDAFRRGLVIAHDSGCRTSELAMDLADVEAEFGETASAFDHVTLALRNYHDSGNTTMIGGALGVVASLFDRSDATKRRRPSEVSRAVPASHCFFQKSRPRSPTCVMFSATRPTSRSPARVRR